MIVLNSVSKEIGRGRFRRLVVDGVSWTIAPRSQTIILGYQGTGASILLDIIAGTLQPTEGWVERRATISAPRGFLRYMRFGTARHLIDRLSQLYNADPRDVVDCVETVLQSRRVLDVPVGQLPALLRRQLNMVLTYALPCDFYLFDGAIEMGSDPRFRAFCQQAFNSRRKSAGTIVATHSTRLASNLGGAAAGAILYRGKLTLYGQLADAITIFDNLLPEEGIPKEALADPEPVPEEDDAF